MPLKLQQVISDAEFPDIVRCEFDAMEDPRCNLKQLFFPIKGDAPGDRDGAIEEATRRQTQWHREDPTSQWVKVVDEETGQVIAAACWHIYETDPYAVEAEGECDWWDAGEDREIANGLMGQFLTPRMTWMHKPHAFLDMLFTLPEHRRRGAGRMMMQWGLDQADAKGLEAYIDSTDSGRDLYRVWGFVEGHPVEFAMDSFPVTTRRRELERELLPFKWWPMHRPVGGRYEEGKGLLPWEKE